MCARRMSAWRVGFVCGTAVRGEPGGVSMSQREDADVESELEELVPQAHLVRENAYAPYSRFKVGAVLLGESGRVYAGCNVENASYGLCLCAERSAVAQAVALGERRFRGIVIATQSEPPSPPCGLCRQTLVEFARRLPVLLVSASGTRVRTSLDELLPMSFTQDNLD